MKRWTVILSELVQRQIDDQAMHIARHSIDNALAWEARLDAAVQGLANLPGYGVDEDASARLGYEVRKLVFEGTYLIHYRREEQGGVVQVINFRHGARLPRATEP